LLPENITEDLFVAVVAVNIGMVESGNAVVQRSVDQALKHLGGNGMPAPGTGDQT